MLLLRRCPSRPSITIVAAFVISLAFPVLFYYTLLSRINVTTHGVNMGNWAYDNWQSNLGVQRKGVDAPIEPEKKTQPS